MAYVKKYSKRSSKSKRVYKRKTAKPSKIFAKKVLSIIHKQTETKQAYYTSNLAQAPVLYNSAILFNSDATQVFPNIAQGTADNLRIGDQIRAQKLSVRGYIIMQPVADYNVTSNRRIGIRLMCLSCKVYGNLTDTIGQFSTRCTSLLKKGGVTTAFSGNPQDLYADINTDLFTVHYNKVVYMSQDALIGPTPTMVANSLAIPTTFKHFAFNLKLKNKLCKYDSVSPDSSLLPVDYAPFICLGYCHLDGSTPDVAITQVGMLYDTVLQYEDA